MSSNRFHHWYDGRLQAWDLNGTGPVPDPDLRFFAEVFRLVDTHAPDGDVDVIATRDIGGDLPIRGPRVVVLFLGDERVRPPAYGGEIGLLVRTYGRHRAPYVAIPPPAGWSSLPLTIAQEILVQLNRLAHSARAAGRRAPIVDVPLGLHAMGPVTFVDFDDRPTDVVFAGSLVNRPTDINRRIRPQKFRARTAFLRDVDRTRLARPQYSFVVHTVTSTFAVLDRERAYLDELMGSRIALCPRGSSRETYRVFEAMKSGCVPICEPLPRRSYYSGAPFVVIRSWRRLPGVLDDLFADRVALRERHKASMQWYADHGSPESLAAQIAAAMPAR
jgi:hypothetical protein